ncbi:MAG: Fic family protein [Armatimonadota bacterium]
MSWELVNRQSEADRALACLSGVAANLPNPHLLIRPFMRKEAVLSSRIEGTQASLSDLFWFEADVTEQSDAASEDALEVSNYVTALEYGLSRLEELPPSLRLLRELHERLLSGVRGGNLTPGYFRDSQNWIGPAGCPLPEAVYVPPPPEKLMDVLGPFEDYLHTDNNLPPLIRLALIHYQFEAIHPFLDGNGRIGRLLIILLMCHWQLLSEPLLYLSAYFNRNRQRYYQLLLNVSLKGSWLDWIEFFLQGVAEQARDATHRSMELLGLWDFYRERLRSPGASALQLKLLDELFALPVVTTRRARELLDVTPKTALNNIDKLVDAGILEEVTGKKRYKVWVAPEIIDTVQGPDE